MFLSLRGSTPVGPTPRVVELERKTKMSAYLNPHLSLEAVLADARAARAQIVGDAVVKGVRFLGAKVGALYARLQAAHKQRAAVAQLMAMDERMLQDIGLNRSLVPFVVADVGVGLSANDNVARKTA